MGQELHPRATCGRKSLPHLLPTLMECQQKTHPQEGLCQLLPAALSMLPSELPGLSQGGMAQLWSQLLLHPAEVSLDSPALGPAQHLTWKEVTKVVMSALETIPEGRTGSGDGAPASGPSWEPPPELRGAGSVLRADPEPLHPGSLCWEVLQQLQGCTRSVIVESWNHGWFGKGP